MTELPPTARSAVTNGRKLFAFGNGNTAWARRFRDLMLAHISDLGGSDAMSAAQLSLVRRAATLEVQLEAAEGDMANGDRVDLAAYAAASGALHRILKSLGLGRKAQAEPTLKEYLQEHYGAPQSASGEPSRGRGRRARSLTSDHAKADVVP